MCKALYLVASPLDGKKKGFELQSQYLGAGDRGVKTSRFPLTIEQAHRVNLKNPRWEGGGERGRSLKD